MSSPDHEAGPGSGNTVTNPPRIAGIEATAGKQDVDYMTIEGMRGQEYSVGIFVFMLVGVFVFVTIIVQFMRMAHKAKTLRKGELILFLWIILGTLGAITFGGLQLLQGRLF